MAGFRITAWHANKLLRRVPAILDEYGPVIAEETKRQIATQKWDWDRKTLRFLSRFQSGTPNQKGGVLIAPGLRDIVDTGNLLRSQTPPVVTSSVGRARLQIEWTAPYSGLVLQGGDFGSYVNVVGQIVKPGVRPGRNWIRDALLQKPLLPFFVERWRQL